MPGLLPALDGDAEARAAQRSRTLGLIERWRAIEARTRAASERASSRCGPGRRAAFLSSRRATSAAPEARSAWARYQR